MSARVAEAMALDADEVGRVRMAALLHDIGKVGIPDEILHKPGQLDEREWELMRQHPVIGERILRMIPGLGAIARIVRHEHERWDGGGYPDGLVGDATPLGSRIILACDAYHAMTSDRPYRAAMPARGSDGGADAQLRHPVRPRGGRGAYRLPVRATAVRRRRLSARAGAFYGCPNARESPSASCPGGGLNPDRIEIRPNSPRGCWRRSASASRRVRRDAGMGADCG